MRKNISQTQNPYYTDRNLFSTPPNSYQSNPITTGFDNADANQFANANEFDNRMNTGINTGLNTGMNTGLNTGFTSVKSTPVGFYNNDDDDFDDNYDFDALDALDARDDDKDNTLSYNDHNNNNYYKGMGVEHDFDERNKMYFNYNSLYQQPNDNNNNNNNFYQSEYFIFDKIINTKTDNINELLLSSCFDLNATDYWGNNLLITLSLNNKTTLLEKIIESCISNFAEKTLYDFLIHLVSSSYLTYSESIRIKIIKSLLLNNTKNLLNKQDDFGNTIITHCLNSPKILNAILTFTEADLEIVNLCGNTSVSYCIQNSNAESLDVLIKYMKNNYNKNKIQKILNMKNILTDTPLLLGIKSENIKIVKMLLSTGLIDCNVSSFDNKSALMLAIEKNMTDVCNMLLEVDSIDYNFGDKFGSTPISKAIELDNFKIIFSLLNKNVNINHINPIGRTPLLQSLLLKYKKSNFIAPIAPIKSMRPVNQVGGCSSDLFTEFNEQLPFGSYINNFSSGPESFMKFANFTKSNLNKPSQLHNVIISKLIQLDLFNINTSDLQGNTPFMLICENNDVFLFDMLLTNPNFDPNVKNSKGISSFDYIKKKYDTILCKMFGTVNYCPVKQNIKYDVGSVGNVGNVGSVDAFDDDSSESSDSGESVDSVDSVESVESVENISQSPTLPSTCLKNNTTNVTNTANNNIVYLVSRLLSSVSNNDNTTINDNIASMYKNNSKTHMNNHSCEINNNFNHHIDDIVLRKFTTIKYFYDQILKRLNQKN